METWLCDLDRGRAVQLELFIKQDFHHGDQQVILDHGRNTNHHSMLETDYLFVDPSSKESIDNVC